MTTPVHPAQIISSFAELPQNNEIQNIDLMPQEKGTVGALMCMKG